MVLTRTQGPGGAALRHLAGVALTSLPANLRALAHETNTAVRQLPADHWTRAWRFGLASMGALSLAGLVLASVLFGTLYAGLMWPMAVHEPFGQYVGPQLAVLRRLGQAVAG